MKSYSVLAALLAVLLLPTLGHAREIDSEYAAYIYNLDGFSGSLENLAALKQEMTGLSPEERMRLNDLLKLELFAANKTYWQQRKAAEDGAEPPVWDGDILPGVSMEEQDNLYWLVVYVAQSYGGGG